MVKRSVFITGIIACMVFSVAAFLQASGIVPAIVPSGVPTASKRGNTNVFALASSNSATTAGTVYCDDGSGNLTSANCGGTTPGSVPPPLFSQSQAVTVTSTTSATTLVGTGSGSTTLAAGFFGATGKILRLKGQGFYNQNGDVTTFTLTASLGGTTVFTGVLSPTLASGNFVWFFDAVLTCQSTGTSGTVTGNSLVSFDNLAAAPNRIKWLNATPITINTTISQAFDLKITPGNAVQSFTMTNLVLTGY